MLSFTHNSSEALLQLVLKVAYDIVLEIYRKRNEFAHDLGQVHFSVSIIYIPFFFGPSRTPPLTARMISENSIKLTAKAQTTPGR